MGQANDQGSDGQGHARSVEMDGGLAAARGGGVFFTDLE